MTDTCRIKKFTPAPFPGKIYSIFTPMDIWSHVVSAISDNNYVEDISTAISMSRQATVLCRLPGRIHSTNGNLTVAREGDVLVGWYVSRGAIGPKTIGVRTGGEKDEHVVTVEPGQFQYCLRGTHPLCMINLQYVQVYITVNGNCDAQDVIPVFAYFPDSIRRQLATYILLHCFEDDMWYLLKSHAALIPQSSIGNVLKSYQTCQNWINFVHIVPDLRRRMGEHKGS